MINSILKGIIGFIISLVSIILSPIDTLITNYLPNFSNALTSINDFIDYVISVIGYVVDLSLIGPTVLGLIAYYYTFIFTVSIAVSSIKFALKWYKALKP